MIIVNQCFYFYYLSTGNYAYPSSTQFHLLSNRYIIVSAAKPVKATYEHQNVHRTGRWV